MTNCAIIMYQSGGLQQPSLMWNWTKLCCADTLSIIYTRKYHHSYTHTHTYKHSSVCTWSEWSTDLFKPYVQKLMALKITASGWPNDVLKSDNPDRAKQEFVIRNELEYGIKLDPSKIALNEGMRFTTKVCASSVSVYIYTSVFCCRPDWIHFGISVFCCCIFSKKTNNLFSFYLDGHWEIT